MAVALTQVVGLAYVVDSSLTVASEWSAILKDYMVPLLARVMENNHPTQTRAAFVCYGPAGNRPQPILDTEYFTEPTILIQNLKKDPSKYGIGQTGNNGDNGLAALEAMAAAIELFDTLKDSMEKAVPYIIHIAAYPPDSAERPLYNTSPRLDSLTWDSLPTEMKKRDIHYTNILLRRIPKFTQFFNAAANGPMQQAWFTTRPHHQLHICGLPARKAIAKRPNEVSADRSPEAKRVRTQTTQPSPKSSPKKAETPKIMPAAVPPPQAIAGPSNPPPLPSGSSTTAPALAPSSSAPAPAGAPAGFSGSNISQMTIPQLLTFAEKLNAFENQIKARFEDLKAQVTVGKQVDPKQISEMQTQGQMAHKLREEIAVHLKENPHKAEQVKQFQMRRLVTQQQRLMQSGQQPRGGQQAQNQGGQGQQGASSGQGANVNANSSTGTGANTNVSASQVASVGAPSASQANATSELAPLAGSQMPQLTPAMAAQFQKLEQQRNRTPHMPPAAIPPSSSSPSKPDSQGDPSGSGPNRIVPLWAGTLTWKDPSPAVSNTYTASAVVHPNSKNGSDVNTNGWPSSIQLAFDDEPAPPAFAVAIWKENHKNTPVFMLPITADQSRDDSMYRLLSKYLSDNKRTARATWPNPDGQSSSLLFVFPFKDGQPILASLYFPLGTSDLPKGMVVGFNLHTTPPRLATMLMKLPRETQEVLSRLPTEQRQQQVVNFLKAMAGPMTPQVQASLAAQFQAHKMIYERAQAQAQAQAQATPQMRQAMPPGAAPAMNMNMMNMSPQQQAQAAAMQGQQGNVAGPSTGNALFPNANVMQMGGHMQNSGAMHQRTPSGGGGGGGGGGGPGGIGNISPEMLQSFMQRNTGATGGM